MYDFGVWVYITWDVSITISAVFFRVYDSYTELAEGMESELKPLLHEKEERDDIQ
jgi:hypothetical protein